MARTVFRVPSRRLQRPDPPPLETDDVTVVAVGTMLWAIGLLVLLLLVVTEAAEVPGWWLGMCGYGIALGLYGVRYCRRRRAAIERDRAQGIPRRS
jgi:hypothetical protein